MHGYFVSDLHRAFVKQRRAIVEVRETEDGQMLEADKVLFVYFVPPEDSAAAAGPGTSKDNALFLTLPQEMQPGEQPPGD